MRALWYPLASRYPGPAGKVHGVNNVRGAVLHSAEGYGAGLLYELARPDRSAAWHVSVLRDGTVWQHYPFNNALYHGGSAFANYNLIGVEHEGFVGQPLTVAQGRASVALARWLAQEAGWAGLVRGVRGRTLYEHREVADEITACPSGRIEWDYYLTLPAPLPPAFSPKWDMRQAFRVYAATNSGRAVVTELPEAGGFHRWTVTIPRNAP